MRSGIRSDPRGWTDARHRRGLAGELRAIRHLLAAGWTIEAHRFRVGRTELDIVARRGPLVAFVEVKARGPAAAGYGGALAAVTAAKQRDLVRAAQAWAERHGRRGDVYRFDCVALEDGRLTHLEDAFRPGWR